MLLWLYPNVFCLLHIDEVFFKALFNTSLLYNVEINILIYLSLEELNWLFTEDKFLEAEFPGQRACTFFIYIAKWPSTKVIWERWFPDMLTKTSAVSLKYLEFCILPQSYDSCFPYFQKISIHCLWILPYPFSLLSSSGILIRFTLDLILVS